MLDRRFIRDNPEAVRAAVRVKGIDLDVDELLSLDRSSRELQRELDKAQTQRKAFAKEFAKADEDTRTKLKAEHDEQDLHLREVREQLGKVNEALQALLLLTPTVPWTGAPVGSDDSANVTIKTWGEKPAFDFPVSDHVELLENRGWAEFARARKVAGERAYALTGDMVLLERALLSYALDRLIAAGSTVISVPVMVREEALVGTGQFPSHREETYSLPADNLYLAGTAEVALVGLHSGEILDARALPIRYAGISPCFRREAGSAGRVARPVPRDAQLLVAARLAGQAGQHSVPRHRRHGEVRLHAEQHRDRDAPAAGRGRRELPDSRPEGPGAPGAHAVPRRPDRAVDPSRGTVHRGTRAPYAARRGTPS